ncbi:uncharacterized protein LOC141863186 [Acropora palmata]|uniref:uncharacterized protein LOC141863186 n=1 Tax=Acropora palmata TaxID=6131 RepID=UPI003DA17327
MNTKVVLVAVTLASMGALVTALGCEVSLPQKATLSCRLKRRLERTTMKHLWKLAENKFGFMMLNRTPTEHVLKTFIDPFSRFNMEQYIQTVLTSDLTHSVYNVLVKNAREIKHNYNYDILSKYFAMASKLGGEIALRPSQYEAFVKNKDEWISDKFFTQQRLAGVNPMSLMRVTNSWKGLNGSEEVIERYLEDVQQWMVVNKLKLNGDKTELLFLTARHRHPPPLDSILIG